MRFKIKIKVYVSPRNNIDQVTDYLITQIEKRRIIEFSQVIRGNNNLCRFSVELSDRQYNKFMKLPLSNNNAFLFDGIYFRVSSFKVKIIYEPKEIN